MKYLGTFELQPLYDSHQSFYGKAFVERYATSGGTKLMLRSYGTVVAVVTPVGMDGEAEAFRIEISMRYLSATTLRHVKEFLAQTDDTFKGITLPWIRKRQSRTATRLKALSRHGARCTPSTNCDATRRH